MLMEIILFVIGALFGAWWFSVIILPIFYGLPKAIMGTVNGQLRAKSILASLVAPLLWTFLFIVIAVILLKFIPRVAYYLNGSTGFIFGQWFGIIGSLISAFSASGRKSLKEDYCAANAKFEKEVIDITDMSSNGRFKNKVFIIACILLAIVIGSYQYSGKTGHKGVNDVHVSDIGMDDLGRQAWCQMIDRLIREVRDDHHIRCDGIHSTKIVFEVKNYESSIFFKSVDAPEEILETLREQPYRDALQHFEEMRISGNKDKRTMDDPVLISELQKRLDREGAKNLADLYAAMGFSEYILRDPDADYVYLAIGLSRDKYGQNPVTVDTDDRFKEMCSYVCNNSNVPQSLVETIMYRFYIDSPNLANEICRCRNTQVKSNIATPTKHAQVLGTEDANKAIDKVYDNMGIESKKLFESYIADINSIAFKELLLAKRLKKDINFIESRNIIAKGYAAVDRYDANLTAQMQTTLNAYKNLPISNKMKSFVVQEFTAQNINQRPVMSDFLEMERNIFNEMSNMINYLEKTKNHWYVVGEKLIFKEDEMNIEFAKYFSNIGEINKRQEDWMKSEK